MLLRNNCFSAPHEKAQSLTRRPSKLSPTERICRPSPSPNSQGTPSRRPAATFCLRWGLTASTPSEPSLAVPPTVARPPPQSPLALQSNQGDPLTSQSLGLPPGSYQQSPYSTPPTALSSSGLASMPSVLRPGNQRYAGGQSPSRDPANALSSRGGSPYRVSHEDVRVAELKGREEFSARRRQEEEDAELARQLFEEEERERKPISGQNAMIIPGGWVE